MPAPQTSARQPGLPTDYYAPNYKIEVEGRELAPETHGDILEVKVVMDMEHLTSFELSINNWDDRRIDFKYSDTKIFDVGNRVHVQMGYADRLTSMVKGQITTLTPQFPESGQPTLGVSGLDAMFRLRDRYETFKYVRKADWEIAQEVASRNGLKDRVTREGEQHDLVVQKKQDDAQFLVERAKRIGFDCYMHMDPDSGEDTLFFVKSVICSSSTAPEYVFEWGKSLISFSPRLTISSQVGKVTVRGWDSRTKNVFSYTASSEDLPTGDGQSGPAAVESAQQGKQDLVVDTPVTSAEEAKDLAISMLRERAYGFNTGSGQVIGLPSLRPGDHVELTGLGRRFGGCYQVVKATHTLGSSGYHTQFDVRRTHDGGLKK